MDAFFLSYCSVCDKSLDFSGDLYCSDKCRLMDACDKGASKLPSKQLNYPSVLKCPYKYCQDPSDSHPHDHAHAHAHDFNDQLRPHASDLTFRPVLGPVSPPVTASVAASVPDLSLSDDESATEDWDIPALSLDDRYPVRA